MKRAHRAVAALAVTLALGLTGCKKEEQNKPAEAPAPAEAKPGDPPAAQPAPTAATPPDGTQPVAPATDPPQPGLGHGPGQVQVGPRPATVTDKHVAIADKLVESARKFATDLDAAKDDCKKATTVVKTGGPVLAKSMEEAEGVQAELASDSVALQWLSQTYGPKMMMEMQKAGPTLEKCREDKEFETAFKNLQMGGGGGGKAPPPAQPPASK